MSDQPPSGGCVLKRLLPSDYRQYLFQPPSGGCVLKRVCWRLAALRGFQPPSGGCVLKQGKFADESQQMFPAAFRRLCVETLKNHGLTQRARQPPSGGCVLKLLPPRQTDAQNPQPPSGGCVLKPHEQKAGDHVANPAAFRRLCVETIRRSATSKKSLPSRLQAAVC